MSTKLAKGEMSQAITPFHFVDYSNFFGFYHQIIFDNISHQGHRGHQYPHKSVFKKSISDHVAILYLLGP